MPKALLIHATDPDICLAEQPPFPFPVLGITTLAGLFPPEWEVEVVDENFQSPDLSDRPDLLGISSLTLDVVHAYSLADAYRQQGVPVLMGGMHASAMPQEALKHADAVVVGEAEGVLGQVLEDAKLGRMHGIYTGPHPDLTGLPKPRLDLLPQESLERLAPVQSSRGCPRDCDFCSVTPFFGHRYRTRPIEDVVGEVEDVLKAGRTKTFFFVDDNIAGRPGYAKELFKALIPLKIKWGSFASVAMTGDLELMRLARDSGCIELFMGIESIRQENLNASNKAWVRTDRLLECIRIFHDHGIIIEGSFIFGHDHDTRDVFAQTVEFIQKSAIQVPVFGILTPYPATRLRDRLLKEDRLLPEADDWRLYDGSHVLFRPAGMSPEELEEGFLWTKKYCAAPRSIFSRVFRAPKGNRLTALGLNFSMRSGRMRQIAARWPKAVKGPLTRPATW